MTSLLDTLIVALVLASAVAWLGWHFFGPSRSSSSCASGCGKCEEATTAPKTGRTLRVVPPSRRQTRP